MWRSQASHILSRGGGRVKKTGGALGRGRRGTWKGVRNASPPPLLFFLACHRSPAEGWEREKEVRGDGGAADGGMGIGNCRPGCLGPFETDAHERWRIADSDRRARKFAKSPATFIDQG